MIADKKNARKRLWSTRPSLAERKKTRRPVWRISKRSLVWMTMIARRTAFELYALIHFPRSWNNHLYARYARYALPIVAFHEITFNRYPKARYCICL